MDKRTILTITGSDGTGGSGVQADIKTISALGGYAVSAITSITLQNTLGIQEFYDVPAAIVSGQIEAIINDVQPAIVKIGMIRSVSVLSAVVEALLKYEPAYVVYDPVICSSKGEKLMGDDVLSQIQHKLLPLCSLVIISNRDADSFKNIQIRGKVLCIDDRKLHGFTNAFSSAIAFYLSQGNSEEDAIDKAHKYIGQLAPQTSNLTGRSSSLYNDFIAAVDKYYVQNSDVAFYSDYLNVSSRYLAQVCKRIVDKTPKAIIDDYLIQAIEVKLKTTDETIQEIAYDFGFSNQAHFSKFFKKLRGVSPTDYRKNLTS